MSRPPYRDPVVAALAEADEAVSALRTALAGVGLTLPSLGVDLASCTRTVDPRPLVELGRCGVETAGRLAEALRRVEGR